MKFSLPMNRILLFILLIISGSMNAQNLVTNPGFETYSSLPTGTGQYNLATGWGNCNGTGSPDYFSTLGSGMVQLPNCFIGTVNPNSGNGCMGAALHYYSPADFREYLSAQLISPLVIGQTYNVKLNVTNGVTSGTYGGGGIDQISAAFSMQPLIQPGTGPIPVIPQVTHGTVFYSYSWQQISMQFVADSAYSYVTIGNFLPDAATIYQQFDPCPNFGAYYFFDDIEVEVANVAPVAIFNAPNHICPGTCTNFNNLSQNATSYLWDFPGANPSTSIDINPTNICYNSPGTYSVSLIATNSVTSDTLALNNFITVYPYPQPQGIMQNGDTLIANQGAISYQWYYNGNIINGATDYFYIASQNGNYNVVATDVNGCEVEAAIFDVTTDVSNPQFLGSGITLFPNPATNMLSVKCEFEIRSVEIFNVLGEKVIAVNYGERKNHIAIYLENMTTGIYLVKVIGNDHQLLTKFVKK